MALERLTPRDLKARIDRRETLVLLDVRETFERDLCAIPGSRHIPMGEIPARLSELDPATPIVCICHHGVRSARVAALLHGRGFDAVFNLVGGVEGWAAEVDPSMARY